MSTLLCIKAHPLDESASVSVAAAQTFLAAYREANPDDEVVVLDLYEEDIPLLDRDVFRAWKKLQSGDSDSLSPEERRKVERLQQLSDQFVAADKYVFVTPMWNFSYPPLMKAYIDAVAVAGKTFKYTAQGPVGLLGGKQALHIQSRGGVYSEGPSAAMEAGHAHLENVMRFFGIPELTGLFIEGHNQYPDRAQEIKKEAVAQARELALAF
ncbi:FMN-dependent NADH-azoreductase [Cohnella caldifontis]|uniref:FMN-dependent NADH-azoreductase n=1 Tax=Cohnella caldifontis TaxID=3027471 RepID=UPI0023EB1A2D|nr:FMN-dependent NADH-azoreductase [Cohnella sp. YIM B05605]